MPNLNELLDSLKQATFNWYEMLGQPNLVRRFTALVQINEHENGKDIPA